MSEQFNPGRVGFRDKLRGPFLAEALTNELAIMERYNDHWSRLWAISYDPSQITPDERTGGWWLLAEFRTRNESRLFCLSLHKVYDGARRPAIRAIPFPAADSGRSPCRDALAHVACPTCGCTVIKTAKLDDLTLGLVCDDCGRRGRFDVFRRAGRA